MNPLISIISPVYNCENFLDTTINSVINQTYKNWELILVNDGSTDSSAKIIQSYLEKDTRIILISKENGGQASARNFGLKKANPVVCRFRESTNPVVCRPKSRDLLFSASKKVKTLLLSCTVRLTDKFCLLLDKP